MTHDPADRHPDPAAPIPGEATVPAASGDASRLAIWTFLATELLLFGGLFTVYSEFRVLHPKLFHAEHLRLDRFLGATNTVVLICSSLTVALGIDAIRRGRQRALQRFLLATILLAFVFLGIKYVEWTEDFAHGLFPRTNLFWGLYFVMTGLHGLHVAGGIVVLGAILFLARRGTFSERYYAPVEVAGLYWHFVDIVWIYLFPLLYLVG